MNKVIFALPLLLTFLGCSSPHEGLYIYNSEIYTTSQPSDFEMGHFYDRGYDKVLILNGESSPEQDKTNIQISDMCKRKSMTCSFVTVKEGDPANAETLRGIYRGYAGTKFLLASNKPERSAFFIGLINLAEHKGTEQTLDGIFDGLGVANPAATRAQIAKATAKPETTSLGSTTVQ